jgi:hypothetical protein
MNKILSAAAAIIGFTASAALAQMGGHEGMGSRQSPQMMGGQMMGQDMMQDMTEMMKQMNGMMQKMSHTMEHKTVTEHAKMQDMAKIMREMAAQMHEMAAQMDKGKMDAATVKKMQEKMKAMNQSIENLQKEGK